MVLLLRYLRRSYATIILHCSIGNGFGLQWRQNRSEDTGSTDTEDTGAEDTDTADTSDTEDTSVEDPDTGIETPDSFWTEGPALPDCTPQEGTDGMVALSGVVLSLDGPVSYVVQWNPSSESSSV